MIFALASAMMSVMALELYFGQIDRGPGSNPDATRILQGIITGIINADARRGGTGRALVEHVLEDAGARGVVSVSLEVRTDNEAATELYRSLGFSNIGLRRNYYGQGEDAAIMERRLA